MNAAYPTGSSVPRSAILPSFLNEAGRLRSFAPPFRFSAFFSPEDTLLCVCASETALVHAHGDHVQVAELTTGSGLIGLRMLEIERDSRLVGLDIDPAAVEVATHNAEELGFSSRARFECADLWSDSTIETLRESAPDLIICNPPYVPEPPGKELELEAGSGPDGTAHLVRTLEIAAEIRPRALSLSWCSLSDPAKVVEHARHAGYSLDALFIVAIADGEYSGSVHEYMQSLPHAYINEQEETLDAVAPDRSAAFCYLLMAGSFTRRNSSSIATSRIVETICERFASEGLSSLAHINSPFKTTAWMLSRWDELALRAQLHGTID